MRQHLMLMITLAALVAAAPLLAACYTTQGAGKDIEAAGQSIQNSAQKNTTYRP